MTASGSRSGPLRTAMAAADLDHLTAVTGATVGPDDAACLFDPRGTRFQRLEWLGDSVVDALLALHRVDRPACCAGLHHADLCSDVVLSQRATEGGVRDVLDWQPGSGRLADWVEAAVGAAWRMGPEQPAVAASRLVHPGLTLTAGRPDADATGCDDLRPLAALGSHVLEAAAAEVLHEDPRHRSLPVGGLDGLRRSLLDNGHLVRVARDGGWLPDCQGDRRHLADHLQAAVGREVVTQGLLAGLTRARRVLGLP